MFGIEKRVDENNVNFNIINFFINNKPLFLLLYILYFYKFNVFKFMVIFLNKYLFRFFILCLVSISFSSCARKIQSDSLMSISLDMNKQQVCNRLGKPSVFRGAIRNKYNQNIEVWEYRVDKGKTGTQIGYELAATALSFGFCAPILLSDGDVETYWLYFYQGKLVRWGQAGDWKREADVIYDINFDNQPRVFAPQGLF